jgi:hypothetical protein
MRVSSRCPAQPTDSSTRMRRAPRAVGLQFLRIRTVLFPLLTRLLQRQRALKSPSDTACLGDRRRTQLGHVGPLERTDRGHRLVSDPRELAAPWPPSDWKRASAAGCHRIFESLRRPSRRQSVAKENTRSQTHRRTVEALPDRRSVQSDDSGDSSRQRDPSDGDRSGGTKSSVAIQNSSTSGSR